MDIPNRAVALSFTQNYLHVEFKVLYESIKRIDDTPIYVTPIRFDSDGLKRLEEFEVNIVKYELNEEIIQSFGKLWGLWTKPYYIRNLAASIKEDNVLWMDVDTFIANPLDPIFRAVEEDFVVVHDYFCATYPLNDPELYNLVGIEIDEKPDKHANLNSGVLGFNKKRDMHILDKWLNNTELIEKNVEIRKHVRFHDQGVLLWTMHEMGMIHKIRHELSWNHPASRNAYEEGMSSKRWPSPDIERMGGDLIDEMKLDNRRAIVAHFAGPQKLHRLIKTDDNVTKFKTSGKQKTVRIFCVGMERCGTRTIAEMLRRACFPSSWVRHEYKEPLTEEVELKLRNANFWSKKFKERLMLYNRDDVALVSDSNHWLGYFIDEISQIVKDSKFIVILRDPVEQFKSKLRVGSVNPRFFGQYPDGYQSNILAARSVGGSVYEKSRPKHASPLISAENWVVETQAWEMIESQKRVFNSISKLPENRRLIVRLENIEHSFADIERITEGHVRQAECKKWARYKFGQSMRLCASVEEWIEEQAVIFAEHYLKTVEDSLNEYWRIIYPS
jgi:lipopolysaccharide biosynthesis glycosyltransferase